jgi:hypothetical protein
LRSLCLMMWPAIFADNANGNLISLTDERELFGSLGYGIHRDRGGRHRGNYRRRNVKQTLP